MCPWNRTPTFLCKLVLAHLQPFNTSEPLVVVLEGVIFCQADFEHLFQRVRNHPGVSQPEFDFYFHHYSFVAWL